MTTIRQIAHRLFPDGTNPDDDKEISKCPDWPPDVFAFAATITELGGLYAEPWCTAGWNTSHYPFDEAWRERVTVHGADWARDGEPPEAVREMWRRLIGVQGDEEIANVDGYNVISANWQRLVLELLATADEASSGVGFVQLGDRLAGGSFIALLVGQAMVAEDDSEPHPELPHVPVSVCRMVPPVACCVQPKTSTPTVGCTLRSLTHHLALLPSIGIVESSWMFGHPDVDRMDRPLNVLVVPFPYVIHGDCFEAHGNPADPDYSFFSINPNWLAPVVGDADTAGSDAVTTICDFLCGLIEVAEREVGEVHGIVLPELALKVPLGNEVADEIAKRNPGLELFISGVSSDSDGDQSRPMNGASIARFHKGELLRRQGQSKHHRWRLDRGQIGRYHLGHAFDPDRIWWEKIDVGGRMCAFNVVRPGASLAVLICEDLARFDPVLPVINAIGPTLVIALLMDGPQMERRWPGRYATVLADDPGSSVLTLTSLGMIRRSTEPGAQECRQIALWKEPGESARELTLPPGDHALLLTLTSSRETQTTLDTRVDRDGTRRLRLHGVRGVRHPGDEDGKPLKWPEY